jgi:hypothetical protein
MALDLASKQIIEEAAMAAAMKLQGEPEAVAYLAGALALYLPSPLRTNLSAYVAELDSLLHTSRLH